MFTQEQQKNKRRIPGEIKFETGNADVSDQLYERIQQVIERNDQTTIVRGDNNFVIKSDDGPAMFAVMFHLAHGILSDFVGYIVESSDSVGWNT